MPVGIDLVCLPVAERKVSRRGIGSALYLNWEACQQGLSFGPDALRGATTETWPWPAMLQLK